MNPDAPEAPSPEEPPAVSRDEQLAGVAHLHPTVETCYLPGKGCFLAWRDLPKRKRGVLDILLAPLMRRRHRVMLDPIGQRTVELIDGTRSVGRVAEELAFEFDTDVAEAEEATLAFLGRLMQRNIVVVTRSK